MLSFDLRTTPPALNYKLMTGLITPRPIALVTTMDAQGRVNAAPFSYFNAFGSDPAIVVLGLGNRPGTNEPKDTPANIAATHEFVVHLVDEAIAEKMNACSEALPPGRNEMEKAGFTAIPSIVVKPPRIAESAVHFECVEEQRLQIGRNRLILGRVLMAHVREGILDPENQHVFDGAFFPIGRMHGRGWYTRTRDQFEMIRPE
jgi:flavin reductase (DIM6/NTAB) family NADH-FMN oxidoreductase RutF